MADNRFYVHVELEPSDGFHNANDAALARNVVREITAHRVNRVARVVFKPRQDEQQVGQLQQEVLGLKLKLDTLKDRVRNRQQRIVELTGITERQHAVTREQEERIGVLEAQIARVRDWGSVADVGDATEWQEGYRACSERIMKALDVDPAETLADDAHRRNKIERVQCEYYVPTDRITQTSFRCVRAKMHPLVSEDGVGCSIDDKETLS